jgi:hypothetical protein
MNNNIISVAESTNVKAAFENTERMRIGGMFRIEKFRLDKSGRLHLLDDFEFPNLVTNVGGALMLDKLIGAAGTVFDNTNGYIGIGDSATAAAVGQTDLQAASNKTRVVMDATFPSRSGQVMTFKATFGTGVANYAWNEIGLFNAAAAGSMFSRALVSSPFTKTAGLSIVATYTLTCP